MADPGTIVVVGSGVARGSPDQCVLHLALNGMGSTPAEALDICTSAAEGAIGAMAAAGVERQDIRTSLTVQDFYDHTQQKVTARVGSYRLEVTVRELESVGRVIGALSDAAGGALQIQGIQLGLRDPSPMWQEARQRAVRDARRKAEDIANEAEIRLGPIRSIEALGGPVWMTQTGSAMPMVGRIAASLPVEPGEVSVTAGVTVTYGILD